MFSVGSRVEAHSDGHGWQKGLIMAPPQGNGNMVPVKFDVNGRVIAVPLNLLRLEQKQTQQSAGQGQLQPGQRVKAKSDQGAQAGAVVSHQGNIVKIKFDINGQTYDVPQNLVIPDELPSWMNARGTKGYFGNDIDDYGEYDDNEGGPKKKHPFKLGMAIEVYSKSCGGWMPGRVMEIGENEETPYIDVDYSDKFSNFESSGFNDDLRLMSKKLRLFDPALATKLRPSAETPNHPPYKPREQEPSGNGRSDFGGQRRQGGGGFGNGPSRRPGDWTCPQCGAHCFGSKESCYKCGTPKPGGKMASKGPTSTFGGSGATLYFD